MTDTNKETNYAETNIYDIVKEAIDLFVMITRDIIKDENDLDELSTYTEQLNQALDFRTRIISQHDIAQITWTLAEVSMLSFITGQLVNIRDEDPELLKKFYQSKIYPSY